MFRKFIPTLLCLALLLSGCTALQEDGPTKYQATFLTLFDTVTYINGYADSQEVFTAAAQAIHDELLTYHQLFDIYNDYESLNNLKTINDNAGLAPVQVDQKIIDLLLDCRAYYEMTGGLVNVAMGSVLRLWHEARSDGIDDPANASLPSQAALEEAASHTSWDCVIIDESASTVYLTDPEMSLDVGAVAKGWSAQRAAENAPEGMAITVGGNVCATGAKPDGSAWVVGVTNPDQESEYLNTLYLTKGSMVTSGDYQRYYVVDGQTYHHIIDPATLYPSTYWRSVTIVCADSGLADALSTALFLLPLEEGQELAESLGAQAMWVDAEGNCYYSAGFEALIRT